MTLQWTQELAQEAADKIATDLQNKAIGSDWEALDADEKKSVLSDWLNVVLDDLFALSMDLLERLLIEENTHEP